MDEWTGRGLGGIVTALGRLDKSVAVIIAIGAVLVLLAHATTRGLSPELGMMVALFYSIMFIFTSIFIWVWTHPEGRG